MEATVDPQAIVARLAEEFGIPTDVRVGRDRDSTVYGITLSGTTPLDAFVVSVRVGWRSLECTFRLGSYARSLLEGMEEAVREQMGAFSVYAEVIARHGGQLVVVINGVRLQSVSTAWPAGWTGFEMHLRKPNIAWGEQPQSDRHTLLEWTAWFMGLVVSLLPLDPVDMAPEHLPEVEGGWEEASIRRYERSRLNRAACVQARGHRCTVCGFDFETEYGDIGRGFIHVHHLEEISRLKPGTTVDPAVDLIPVCPNCHAMIHRTRPCLRPEELGARTRRRTGESAQ